MSISLIPNPDKKWNETWKPNSDLANFPAPSRIVLCGKPNSGKSSIIMNLLLKADPPYQRIYLLHPELKASGDMDADDDIDEYDGKVSEYQHIDFVPLYELPTPSFFNTGLKKQCLIIDDIELKTINKEQKKRLNKLVSFASSHYNLSVFISTQDSFSQVPPCILRFCNVFILWKYTDLNYLRMLLNRMGIAKKSVNKIIEEMMNYNTHDSLTIDNTIDSPAKYRKNLYIPLRYLE